MPAKSTPRVNGGSGLSWYSPRLSSRSGNETPTACTSTSTSSGPGVGLGDLADLEVLGTGGLDDLDGAHAGHATERPRTLRHQPNLQFRPNRSQTGPVIEIEVDVADLAQVRFTTDAVWETAASLHALVFSKHHLLHQRIRRLVPRHPEFDLEHLLTMVGDGAWLPDVLARHPESAPRRPARSRSPPCGRPTRRSSRLTSRCWAGTPPGRAPRRCGPRSTSSATVEALTGLVADRPPAAVGARRRHRARRHRPPPGGPRRRGAGRRDARAAPRPVASTASTCASTWPAPRSPPAPPGPACG